MRLNAEIISTGDEVLTGAVVDTNASFLAERLTETGVQVLKHTTIGDRIDTLSELFKKTGRAADIVVVTGGLGPTQDDLTASAAADAAGLPLAIDAEAMADIERFFRSKKRHMIEANRKQAMFPEGAETLANPVGTAPGFTMKIGKALFFFMPGVPHEMRRMMTDHVLPRIRKKQGAGEGRDLTRVISTFGMGESEAAQRLLNFDRNFPELRLGFQAKYPGVLLKVYGREGEPETVSRNIDAGVSWVCEQLGDRVVSEEGLSLEEVVGALLEKRQETLSVAESCTGGLISHLLTNVPGSSKYFLFSGVTYANAAKTSVIGVSQETIATYGAVHEETAKEMAKGARKAAGATYGLATSGIAGPEGGTADKPVGTVCIGFASPDGVYAKRRVFTFGGRLMKKQMFAAAALDLLRRHIISA